MPFFSFLNSLGYLTSWSGAWSVAWSEDVGNCIHCVCLVFLLNGDYVILICLLANEFVLPFTIMANIKTKACTSNSKFYLKNISLKPFTFLLPFFSFPCYLSFGSVCSDFGFVVYESFSDFMVCKVIKKSINFGVLNTSSIG
jgi:hypothetical protein